MTRTKGQYCEAYRNWHISHVVDGGYIVHDRKDHAHISEGYYESRDEARKEIDWHISHPRRDPLDQHEDSPSLDQPWWHHR